MRPLVELFSRSRALLVDFDGPVCSVFASFPAAAVAEELHALVRRHLAGELPPAVAAAGTDPLVTLRAVATLGETALTKAVADACRDAELAAVAGATPTRGAEEFFQAAETAGRSLFIVSNNAAEAVDAYLDAQGLRPYVQQIIARVQDMDPRRLKPQPFLLHRALGAAQVAADEAVFIGDSTTDVEAGRAAAVPTIGYANKPGKDQRLSTAGAAAVVASMSALTEALQKAPARPEW